MWVVGVSVFRCIVPRYQEKNYSCISVNFLMVQCLQGDCHETLSLGGSLNGHLCPGTCVCTPDKVGRETLQVNLFSMHNLANMHSWKHYN